MPFSTKTDSVSPDELIAGSFPRVTKPVTLLTGTAYLRGDVLGVVTASGKYTLVDSDAEDGSQTPEAILMEDSDASSADTSGIVALTGDFNSAALRFGGTDVAADHVAALRGKSIFIHKTAVSVEP